MMAERRQSSPISARKIVAQYDRCVEGFRHPLEPTDQIYRGPDDGEIEAPGCTDVPVDHLTDVQRYDYFERRFARHCRLVVEASDGLKRFLCRRERICCSSVGHAAVFDREDRQQTIADEFQDLSTMVVDCLRLHIEERIEDSNHPIARQPVRTLGEPAQVRRPEHTGEFLSSPPADLSS